MCSLARGPLLVANLIVPPERIATIRISLMWGRADQPNLVSPAMRSRLLSRRVDRKMCARSGMYHWYSLALCTVG